MKKNQRKCYLCESKELEFLWENEDFVEKKNYSYYHCKNCDLIFIVPLPTVSRLKEIYSFRTSTLEESANPLLFFFYNLKIFKLFFRAFVERLNKERAEFIVRVTKVKKGKILDVGCGTGKFLEGMFNKGWDIIGQEISKKCLIEARKNIKSGLFISTPIEVYKLPSDVDVITFWHVFEHIPNLKKVLANISGNLKRGAYLIVEVPNSNSLSLRLFGRLSPLLITPEHITFWSKKSFEKLFMENNLSIKKVIYPHTFLFTSFSASFIYFRKKLHSNILSFILSMPVFFFSLLIYIFYPHFNESIRVVVRR